MKTNDFEKIAREKLTQDTYPVDVDALWDAIEPEVRPRKRKRFLFLWMATGFGLLISLFFITQKDSRLAQSPISSAEKIHANLAPPIDTIEYLKDSKKISRPKVADNKLKKAPKDIPGFTNTVKSNVKDISGSTNTVKSNVKTTSAFVAVSDSYHSSSSHRSFTRAEMDETQNTPSLQIKQEVLSLTPKIKITKQEQEDQQGVEADAVTGIPARTEDKQPIATVVLGNQNVPEKNDPVEIEEREETDVLLPPPGQSKTRNNAPRLLLGGGVHTGVSYQMVELTTSDPANEAWLQNRIETESNLEQITVGVEALLKTKFNWYLRTGVDYHRSVSQFEFSGTLIDEKETNGLIKTIRNPFNGVVTEEYGVTSERTETLWNKKIFNKIHQINTPIIIGKEFSLTNWTVGVEAGALLNWSLRQSGQILDGSNFYYLDDDPNDWFRNKTEMGWLGSIQVGYFFTPKTQLLVGVVYQSPITLSEDHNPILQKQSNIGLQVAARYWLVN